MTDDERAQVGICYKQQGQDAAIELGHQTGSRESERAPGSVEAFARSTPRATCIAFAAVCARRPCSSGCGMRVSTTRWYWAATRPCAASCWTSWSALWQRGAGCLISGRTGTGKTRVISRLARSVDLEGLANHRGSTFGQLPEAQPSQIDFENALSIALLKLMDRR